jgi:hypothetical protein
LSISISISIVSVVTGSAHTATLIDAVKTTGKSVAVAGKSSVAAVCAEQPSDFLSAVAQFTQSAVKGAQQGSCHVCFC